MNEPLTQMDMFGDHRTIRTRRAKPRLPKTLQPGTGGTMAERFQSFHALNPEVYLAIVEIARDLKGLGFNRGGMKMIFERLRWLHAIDTKGDDFKLNNNFTAFYARLVMEMEADLAGFFEIREQRGVQGV
jgi:hypothetical protein